MARGVRGARMPPPFLFRINLAAAAAVFAFRAPLGPLAGRQGAAVDFVGATLDRERLLRALRLAGFEPCACRAILHCPRVLAVPLAGALQRRAAEPARRRFLALLLQFERLAGWPSAYYTGHFVAVRARKPL